jgi:hypothetical protein
VVAECARDEDGKDRERYQAAHKRPILPEGLRPSDSPTRSLARRFAGALRSRGSLAMLARSASRKGSRNPTPPSNSPLDGRAAFGAR